MRIKMCGMTRKEDIAQATVLGVDAIGLIFYTGSPRDVSLAQAKELLHEIPVFMDVVAVFVNPNLALVREILEELPIGWLQFHGQEPPKFCRQFNKPYIKAMQVHSTELIHQSCADYYDAAAVLLDTPTNHGYGGTGKTFDWHLIPQNLTKPVILAGGLNATNVQHAVKMYLPYAVDVSSGIEVSPGIKDHDKMTQFVNALWNKK